MKKHTVTVTPNTPTTFRFEIKNLDGETISYCDQTIEEMQKFILHIQGKLNYMDNYNYLTKYYVIQDILKEILYIIINRKNMN
jgi:hypothetical protein